MRSVFMTGGAGFLGTSLLRWSAVHQPDVTFTIYSRDEAKHSRARAEFPNARYILGDVRDLDRLTLAMGGHDTVIHAGALKYVPEAEINPAEAISVNLDGSRNIAQAAIHNHVERVIGISTDKACRPVNVYGATKWMMERIFQEADCWSDTRFNLVRYGNVIASTGSVIPMFQEQALNGRVTLTNPGMTRFWLTVQDGIDYILRALDEPRGGTILIPRLAASSMQTVAQAVAEVTVGPKETNAVEYVTIGQRFGEKVSEELLSPVETFYTPDGQGPVMRLYPVTEGIREPHQPHPYNSNTPDRWIDKAEMIALIEQSMEAPS